MRMTDERFDEIDDVSLSLSGMTSQQVDAFLELFYEVTRYRTAEDEGRLPTLPCKVWDTVYVDKRILFDGWRTKGVTAKIAIGKVVSFRKNGNGVFMKIRFSFTEGSKSYMRSCVVSAIGKTVFLTEPEAQQALKGEQNK